MKNGFIFIDLSKKSLWPPREISLDAFTTLTAFSPVEPKSHVWAPSASQRCSQDVIKVEKLLGKVNSLYMGEVPWFVFVSWSLVKTKKHRSPCGANPSSPWRLLLSCSSVLVFPGWRVLLFSLCSKALLCSLGSSLLLFSKPLPYAIYSNSLSGKRGPVPWVLEPETYTEPWAPLEGMRGVWPQASNHLPPRTKHQPSASEAGCGSGEAQMRSTLTYLAIHVFIFLFLWCTTFYLHPRVFSILPVSLISLTEILI